MAVGRAAAGTSYAFTRSYAVQLHNEGDALMIESLPPGTILQGRYCIERALGSGGFGHVYLAVDMVTNQQYAVKEYLVTGPTGQEQLQHEARVLSQLHHPNLPAYHNAFNERGRYYIVLNYIEGNDLTDIIRDAHRRDEVIPISRIMEWLLTTCDAVQFLHSQRPPVIHRDIKPDNIRITPHGAPILVDLGNAKSADGARTLFFIRHQGTPGYAPEEQYPGGSGTDERSDVYALAGTLYFALTMQEPPSVSVRKQATQQRRDDLPSLQERLAGNPPPLSPEEANAARQFRLGVSRPSKPVPRHSQHVAQLGALAPELLNRLNTIIQRAMSMKPKDRYRFVADFASDLKNVVSALPSSSQRTPDPHSTQPDLPDIYETLQAAKGTSPPGIADTNTTPIPPSPTSYCPRCGTVLVPNASFCPRCGTSIAPVARANISPPVHASPGNPQRSKARDIAGEATMRVSPQMSASAQAVWKATTSSSPSLHAAPRSSIQNTPSTATQKPSTPIAQSSFGASNVQHAPPGQTQANTPSSSPSSFNLEPRMMILFAILVVALLVVIVLILNHIVHAHTSIDGIKLWFLLRAPEMLCIPHLGQ